MPYYRRSYAKRRYKKRGVGRSYRRKFSRKARSGMGDGKRFFKLRASFAVTSNSIGVINLDAATNASGFDDWSSISSLFDLFRICATKVRFFPELPNDTSTVTGFRPLYVFADVDSASNPVTTVNQALQYENCRAKNMYKPWSYYYKWPKLTGVTDTTVYQGGYRDIAEPGGVSGIYGFGDGYDVSTQYGTMVITHYLAVKNRR